MNDKLNKSIEIHWWNFGSKTVDFKGTVKECLKAKGINYRKIKHKEDKSIIGYVFTYNQGQLKVRYESFGDFESSVKNILVLQLTYLGDRAKLSYDRWDLDINK